MRITYFRHGDNGRSDEKYQLAEHPFRMTNLKFDIANDYLCIFFMKVEHRLSEIEK